MKLGQVPFEFAGAANPRQEDTKLALLELLAGVLDGVVPVLE